MRKILLFSTAILVATSVLAFGGGGKSRKSSIYRGTGVDSIGVHFNGNGGSETENPCTPPYVLNTKTNKCECPPHSEWNDGKGFCVCEQGYVMTNNVCAETKSTCDALGKYWCTTAKPSCVNSEEDCLNLCPEDRKCGSICCGERQNCEKGEEDNYQCCYMGNCCDVNESSGYGGTCCPLTQIPYHPAWYDEAMTCCNGTFYSGLYGKRTTSSFGTEEWSLCCSNESDISCARYDENGNCSAASCCQENEIAYCQVQNAEGECAGATCARPGAIILYQEGLGVNSNENGTAYCRTRWETGVCNYLNVVYKDCVETCAKQYDNGVCQHAGCCKEGEKAYMPTSGVVECCSGRVSYGTRPNGWDECIIE